MAGRIAGFVCVSKRACVDLCLDFYARINTFVSASRRFIRTQPKPPDHQLLVKNPLQGCTSGDFA